MSNGSLDKAAAIRILNQILKMELTYYLLMIYGYNHFPIVSWLREQADDSMRHAREAGDLIIHLGEHPSLSIGPLMETQKHDFGDLLRKSLEHERAGMALSRELMKLARNRSVLLEEYARRKIAEEETHASEVDKVLRNPGEIEAFANK